MSKSEGKLSESDHRNKDPFVAHLDSPLSRLYSVERIESEKEDVRARTRVRVTEWTKNRNRMDGLWRAQFLNAGHDDITKSRDTTKI